MPNIFDSLTEEEAFIEAERYMILHEDLTYTREIEEQDIRAYRPTKDVINNGVTVG